MEQFDKNKSNIPHTWTTIKEILGKLKNKSDFPDHFIVEGEKINDPFSIANCCNDFFASIWPSLAITLCLFTLSNA